MEEVVQGFLPPMISDMLTVLNLGLSVILLFAVSYLFSARRSLSEQIKENEARAKKVSKDLKELDNRVREIKPARVVDSVPQAMPFGLDLNQPRESQDDYSQAWGKFVAGYNETAASLSDKDALFYCESFIGNNGVRLLMFSGMMTFLPALDLEESNYWAWKMPKTKFYAVVPNPLKYCSGEVYERGGLKAVFQSNYDSGTYKKYFVEKPAIFSAEFNSWRVIDTGILRLSREF